MRTILLSCALAVVVTAVAGCPPSSTGAGEGEGEGAVGGPVAGAQDTHCNGVTPIVTDPAVCNGEGEGEGGEGEGEGEGGGSDYGATMFNSSGDDDDCKYHVSFTVSPVRENQDVNFVVTAVDLTDGTTPVTGAHVRPEVFLSDTHPAPNSGTTTTETTPGQYHVGPIHFDASGQWTVRFHFFENCVDSETSPHGHAAFFINVP